MSDLATFLAAALIVAGAAFSCLAALGVLRFPDVYTRLHAASKAGLLGLGLIFLAIAVSSGDPWIALRAIAGAVFLFLTSPLAAHLLANAALKTGIPPVSNTNNLGLPPS
ncbi:MAG TPA: monovalent cation/H(+) antiporter subunit G [Devosia sp.]|nr:monovalent cation/H(+) antiporter subunit G [Devosia sp.]